MVKSPGPPVPRVLLALGQTPCHYLFAERAGQMPLAGPGPALWAWPGTPPTMPAATQPIQ